MQEVCQLYKLLWDKELEESEMVGNRGRVGHFDSKVEGMERIVGNFDPF